MSHHSSPALTQQRHHLKWILLAVLLLLNLAAFSRAQSSAEEPQAITARTDPKSTSLPNNLGFAILVGAGLLIAGRKRSKKRQLTTRVAAADFEMAFRMQNLPRVRVDQTLLYRDRSVCLRRTASSLGCDQ